MARNYSRIILIALLATLIFGGVTYTLANQKTVESRTMIGETTITAWDKKGQTLGEILITDVNLDANVTYELTVKLTPDNNNETFRNYTELSVRNYTNGAYILYKLLKLNQSETTAASFPIKTAEDMTATITIGPFFGTYQIKMTKQQTVYNATVQTAPAE